MEDLPNNRKGISYLIRFFTIFIVSSPLNGSALTVFTLAIFISFYF